MNAVVFLTAGGKGNRLRSHLNLEEDLPKALAVTVKNRPLIAYQLDILVKLKFPTMFLTKRAFEIYVSMPIHTYRSVFLRTALEKGEKFKVVKPSVHVHMDYIEDYHKLINILK